MLISELLLMVVDTEVVTVRLAEALLDREKLALAERELRALPEELREELWLKEPEPEGLPL